MKSHFARPGDTLVVWRLDRLGCSLRHLIDTIGTLYYGKTNSIADICRTLRISRATPYRYTKIQTKPT